MGKGIVYGQVYSLIRQERAGLLDALKVFAGRSARLTVVIL